MHAFGFQIISSHTCAIFGRTLAVLVAHLQIYSFQANLTPEASGRPETRLEFLNFLNLIYFLDFSKPVGLVMFEI